jgi:hypothetical protein
MGTIHKKYKGDKSKKTHVMEEHNNKDNPNKNKTVNKKDIVYHKLPNDKGALVGMCGRDEECFPNATTH